MHSPVVQTKAVAAAAAPLSVVDQFPDRAWMKYERAQRIVSRSRILRRLTLGAFAQWELLILKGHKNRATVAAIRRCRRVADSLLTANEAFLLHSLVAAQRAAGYAMAEFGVYQGSSARIMCEAKGDCALHLFDTFSGMPDLGEQETVFARGQFAASLASVRKTLGGYSQVHFHPGVFPESAQDLDSLRFSLVHLDVDLYASTRAGLEFFYPRMIPGGIVITHDYSILTSVARAFSEFMREQGRSIIELPTTQAMVVI